MPVKFPNCKILNFIARWEGKTKTDEKFNDLFSYSFVLNGGIEDFPVTYAKRNKKNKIESKKNRR